MLKEQLCLWPELSPFYRQEKNIDWVDISTLPDDPGRKKGRNFSDLPTGKYILFKTGGHNIYFPDKKPTFPFLKNIDKGFIITAKAFGTNGYPSVGVYTKYGKSIHFYIHRLIGISFLENPEKRPIVDHINKNTLDYEFKNLKWDTYSGNSQKNARGQYKILSGTYAENLLNLAKKGNGL